MSLYKYEIFNAVVAHGSVTKAAQELNLSQSGISHALSSLEAEFGFALLARDRSGINLTNNGSCVLAAIREVLRANEQLKEKVAAINGLEIGVVRIGTFTSVSVQWLPGIIAKFQSYHPSIEIEMLDGNYNEIEFWIANDKVDFGFVSLPTVKNFETIPLKKDPLLCILPKSHRLHKRRSISLTDIKDDPFIMPKWGRDDDIERIFAAAKVKIAVKFEVTEAQAIIAMVKKGLGVSILPEMVLPRKLDGIHLAHIEPAPYRMIGIAARSIKNATPAAKKFMDCIRPWLQEHL